MTEIEPIVEDGELNVGRHATLWHRVLGPLDRVTGRPEPADGALFRAPDAPGPATIYVEYSAKQAADAWEESLFESPLHAQEVEPDARD